MNNFDTGLSIMYQNLMNMENVGLDHVSSQTWGQAATTFLDNLLVKKLSGKLDNFGMFR